MVVLTPGLRIEEDTKVKQSYEEFRLGFGVRGRRHHFPLRTRSSGRFGGLEMIGEHQQPVVVFLLVKCFLFRRSGGFYEISSLLVFPPILGFLSWNLQRVERPSLVCG